LGWVDSALNLGTLVFGVDQLIENAITYIKHSKRKFIPIYRWNVFFPLILMSLQLQVHQIQVVKTLLSQWAEGISTVNIGLN
jgi:hypothetical protein